MNDIGIKLADGTFYPILSDAVRFQNIELTTVRDNQETVQIDLFQKGETLEYIGSLIVEDIAQKKAGESTISLKLEVDENENLKAEAADLDSGAGQTLKVSLAAVTPNDEGNDFNLNDFELSPQKDFSEMSSENFISETTAEHEAASFGAGEKKFPKWLAAILILLGIAVLVLAVLLLGRSCSNKKPASGDDVASIKVPAPETTSKVPEPANDTINVTGSSKGAETGSETGNASQNDAGDGKSAESDKTGSSEGNGSASDAAGAASNASNESDSSSASATSGTTEAGATGTTETAGATEKTSSASAASATGDAKKTAKLQTNPDGSVRYLLKWGDTLWDLAETFYKNPWDYVLIAKYNKIKNPSYIIAGTYINIPMK
jgi:lysM domain protein